MNPTFDAEPRARWLIQQVCVALRELPQDAAQRINQEFQEELTRAIQVQDRNQDRRNYTRTRFSDMSQPLPNLTIMRHKITETDCWFGVWNQEEGVLKCSNNGENYEFPSTFCRRHYETTRPDRTPNTNAWGENVCQVLIQGEWVSLHVRR